MSPSDVHRTALVELPETAAPPAQEGADIECDQIARLACSVCRTPLSVVMWRDGQGGWRKISGVLRPEEPAISAAFCDSIVRHRGVLAVCDVQEDKRFAATAPTIGSPRVRSLAGTAIRNECNQPVGVLCTVDLVPRVLTSEQEEGLESLAEQLQARVELRQQRLELQGALAEKEIAAARLAASEELFRAFMQASPFLSYIKDDTGRLLFYNLAFARRFKVSETEWIGRTDDQLWGEAGAVVVREHDLKVKQFGRMIESEEHGVAPDGTGTHLRSYKFPCSNSAGDKLLAGVAVDISEELERKAELERYQQELEEANEQLRQLSVTDPLTGLRNRRALEERLSLEFSVARRRRRSLAILLIDVDHFKSINDRWGHDVGDEILRRLASLLRTTVRLPDLVARYGGEEFAILAPESDAEASLGLAGRLMARVRGEAWEIGPVTISIGIATLNDSTVHEHDLIRKADEALYRAKRAGRDRTLVASE